MLSSDAQVLLASDCIKELPQKEVDGVKWKASGDVNVLLLEHWYFSHILRPRDGISETFRKRPFSSQEARRIKQACMLTSA